jgi:hypothetical protein
LFPFLVCAYIFKNPSDVSAQAPSFIPQDSMPNSGIKLGPLEIEGKMALLVVKE